MTWKAPESNSGFPVTGYFVNQAEKESSHWLHCNKEPVCDTKYKVTDLIEDTEYIFRIVAVNKIGEGLPGPKSVPVLAEDPLVRLCFMKGSINFSEKNIS